jgi:hypothetical protein
MDKQDDQTPMERFENLLSRVIRAGKKKADDIEQVIEEAIEPTEKPEADE